MSPTITLLHLAGDVALLLWGVQYGARPALMRAIGGSLRKFVTKRLVSVAGSAPLAAAGRRHRAHAEQHRDGYADQRVRVRRGHRPPRCPHSR